MECVHRDVIMHTITIIIIVVVLIQINEVVSNDLQEFNYGDNYRRLGIFAALNFHALNFSAFNFRHPRDR